ncbi:unnamed protein product [Rotaria socialis]|uniref:Uncharacterized protein n=1 Tax=Rotaria socialis TaxID=392032 RepID=A0A818A766_9BILA|nr:unnamed protein product [Rotaria socialis]CAF3400093.1 unnamed protein product [Rotaria socialis]CAF3573122.1 unnamed protein product [Rotaria socialis]CAF4273680.1 unnamed protein product [Rotaria socialis]CAF4422874.1 unnamed protein product [Rotaria socialis]
MNRRSLSDQSLFSPTRTNRVAKIKSGNLHDRWTVICYVIGLINILSAVWMLIAPEHWYYNLPVGVPEPGPLNIHFIRDIGCTFLVLGFGLLAGGFYFIEFRLPLFTMNTLFYMFHMSVHIHEVVSGRLRMGIFWNDLPSIYLPAVVTLGLNIILIRKHVTLSV